MKIKENNNMYIYVYLSPWLSIDDKKGSLYVLDKIYDVMDKSFLQKYLFLIVLRLKWQSKEFLKVPSVGSFSV